MYSGEKVCCLQYFCSSHKIPISVTIQKEYSKVELILLWCLCADRRSLLAELSSGTNAGAATGDL